MFIILFECANLQYLMICPWICIHLDECSLTFHWCSCFLYVLSLTLMDLDAYKWIWINMGMDVWISGYLDIWISGYLDIWISGYLDIWISGYLDIWISGYLEIWIPGYLDIWIFGIFGLWQKAICCCIPTLRFCVVQPCRSFFFQKKRIPGVLQPKAMFLPFYLNSI